jgi:hypothetical protein
VWPEAAVTKKNQEIRCPRLGGPVPFSYCERCGSEGKPCFKIADCWWPYVDVMGYLQKHLTAEELRELLGHRPQPKLNGILEIIQQARQGPSKED